MRNEASTRRRLVRPLGLASLAVFNLLFLGEPGGPALAAQTIPLEGLIADEAGKPLAGAAVDLKPVLSEFEVARLLLAGKDDIPAAASVKTDAAGRYLLQAPGPGMWMVLATAPGRATLLRQLIPLLEPLSLGEARLQPLVEVKLRVVGADGKPVAGALVQSALRSSAGWRDFDEEETFGWHLPGNRALTDAAGRLTLRRTPKSVLDLLAAAPGWVSVKSASVDSDAVEMTLERGCTHPVVALDPSGQGVAGVILSAGDSPVAQTGPSGTASLTSPCARKAVLHWSTADGRRGSAILEPRPPGATEPPPLRLSLPARPSLLAGRVLERQSRRPLAGAYVWESGDPGGAVRSAATGAYALPLPAPEEEALLAAAPGAGRAQEDLSAIRRQAPPAGRGRIAGPTLLLQSTAQVRGLVVDESGQPVAGSQVEVVWPSEESETPPWSTPVQRTGADGSFRHRLNASQPFQLRATHPSRADAESDQIGLKPGEQRIGLRLVLPPARGAYGRIVDLSEHPVAGAAVNLSTSIGVENNDWGEMREAMESTLHATSDAEGRFRFDKLPSPPLDLQVRASGFAPLFVPRIPLAAAGDEAPASPAKAKRTPPADLGTVVLHPGAVLQGQVVDKAGRPIAGVAISCMPEDLERGSRWVQSMMQRADPQATSGLDGRFEVRDLPAGRKTALFAAKRGFEQARLAHLDVPGDGPVKVVLQATFEIRGTVSDAAGKPISGAAVGIVSSAPTWSRQSGMLGRRFSGRASSDDDGHFALELTETGKLRIEAEAAGFLGDGVDLEVAEPRTTEGVEIVLRPGAAVFGRVYGPDGVPLDRARIWLGDGEGGMAFARGQRAASSNSDGDYRLEGVREGKLSLTAQRPGYSTLEREIEVQAGETRFDLRLERAATLEGRVLDPAGRPVAKARVVAENATGSTGAASRADGTFTLANLEPGTYEIWADHPRYGASDRVEAVLGGAPSRSLELHLREGSTLRGRILGLSFEQLPDVVVAAVREGGSGLDFKEASVDFQGEYRMDGLEAGDWHVSARFGGRSSDGQATVPPVGEAVLDLEFRAGLALAGRVIRAGEPVDQASVLLQAKSGKGSGFGQTDSRGSFRIEGLESGSYLLHVVAFDSALRHQQEVEVPTPGELLIDLPNASLSGRVVESPGGAPIPNAMLALGRAPAADNFDRLLPPVVVASDAEGAFAFQGLAPGSYRIAASKEGFTRNELPVEVGDSGETGGFEIELQRAARQTLQVIAGAGAPRPRAIQVALLDPAGGRVATQSEARVDETGRAEIDVLPGSWELVVMADGFATAMQMVTLPAPLPAVVLDLASYLTVRVPALREINAGAFVELRNGAGRPFRSLTHLGSLDSRFPLFGGQAVITSLPAGTWQITVTTVDGKTLQGSATTRPGMPTEVELGAKEYP